MGRGDKKSRRGKIFAGSYCKTRPKKKNQKKNQKKANAENTENKEQ
ncbi:MAG: 30S ribosomal protein THX [Pyrinomonadaceae bacterium]